MQLRSRRALVLAATVVLAAALAVGAGKAAARITEHPTVWALAGWQIPGDLGVFFGAGEAVLRGDSPYPSGELAPPPAAYYVYPPPLALAIAPLTLPPPSPASSLFTLLGIGAVIGALLALGIRDWRCHALALLYPGTIEALEYGAIGTFLALLVALAWRYRERLPLTAAATAGAVVLKLFLWPLLVWHLLVGRSRTALAAAVGAAALALVTWAAIGFAGLADYPRVLRDLTQLEAEHTYSLFALGRALGLAELPAQAIGIVIGVALLSLAARVRDDRGVLIIVLGAAFALTPILWHHYLVLLVVPVALARPRLSALWLLPLVGNVFDALGWYGGWTYGEVHSIVSVLALTGVVLAASLAAVVRPQTAALPGVPVSARSSSR